VGFGASFEEGSVLSATDEKQTKLPATVPFEMLPTNHMLVKAHINGKGPYNLIFDLGAPVTLLTNRVSEAAGIVKPNAPRSFMFGMRGEAEILKLQIGDLTATKLPVLVLDHPVVNALEGVTGRQIDGLVGFTFFAHYRTTIDYRANQMTFQSTDYEVRDLLKELPNRLMGPKTMRQRVIAPASLWGMQLTAATGSLTSMGVPIAVVYSNSPASHAGLKPGDLLTAIDGRWTTSIADVFAAAAKAEPGRATSVVIQRDGKEQTVTVQPADGA
jgi:hypothetical protein